MIYSDTFWNDFGLSFLVEYVAISTKWTNQEQEGEAYNFPFWVIEVLNFTRRLPKTVQYEPNNNMGFFQVSANTRAYKVLPQQVIELGSRW